MSSTSPIVCPPANTVNPAVPRKRRRRAPATGAADDCFACRKRGVKCDRRRPYCSQCLEHGKECSGYKTQLTWGVGVASRGKLRGLSLPVAKKSTPSMASVTRARETQTSPSQQTLKTPPKAVTQRQLPDVATPAKAKAPATMANIMTYDFVNMDPTGSPTIPELHSPGLHSPGFDFPVSSYDRMDNLTSSVKAMHAQTYLDQSQWRFETPMSSPLNSEFGLSTSSSISGFSDGDMPSPMGMEFPHTPEDLPLMSPSYPYFNPHQAAPQSIQMWPNNRASYYRRAPTSYPDAYPSAPSMCSSLSSNPSHYEPVEDNNNTNGYSNDSIGPCNLSDILYDDGVSGSGTPSPNDIEVGFGYVTSILTK